MAVNLIEYFQSQWMIYSKVCLIVKRIISDLGQNFMQHVHYKNDNETKLVSCLSSVSDWWFSLLSCIQC